MPVEEQRDRLIDLIRHVSSSCHKLVSLRFSVEMMKLFLYDSGGRCQHNWRMELARLGEEFQLRDSCELAVDSLPRISGWDDYVVVPHYPKVSEANVADYDLNCVSEEEGESESVNVSENSESLSNDSFVVEDNVVILDEEDDELSYLDKQLENEMDRRHERYLRKQCQHLSTSSSDEINGDDDSDDDDDDDEDNDLSEDIVEEDEENDGLKNPFIDEEAVEVETEEESENSYSEPDDVDVSSSDQEVLVLLTFKLLRNEELAAEIVNVRPKQNRCQFNSKRRLIVSDSD
ncbi:hypothetical protein DICVIV_04469 [Dictyocaulus viviparus]|uniref:Uncharacterized protein n=1 Tax=Dictyocaulus viviparus TaxID=29172 RepID=A0A0D8Y491_DICVI|nr:hypothetical protein DICVIV_04469 [Dictyocaulus viviparus]